MCESVVIRTGVDESSDGELLDASESLEFWCVDDAVEGFVERNEAVHHVRDILNHTK